MSDDPAPRSGGTTQVEGPAGGDAVPLIVTKTQVPRRRPGLLPRQRLVSFLHSHLDRKLILISAPAGYGKTSLLADFTHETDLPVCWYTLDPFDRDLHGFLAYLIAAITRRFPAFGERSRAFLREVADPGRNLYALVATLVQEIYDAIPEYFVLVLDDHHTVEDQEEINEFLDLFVTYVDEHCHLVLASRTLPALPNLSLLVARRQAAGLSIDELRFTPAEIQALARQNYGLDLTPEGAAALAQYTGGWITGLLLTAVPRWQQAQPDVPLQDCMTVDLYDYFSRQVLDQQQAPLRDFLLGSAVLDELSPGLCDALLGIDRSDDLIDQVRLRNLFVIEFEVDVDRLRYHDLFRDFLQARLRRQDEVRFRALTRRAADLYARQGEWDRAVGRYLALGAYEPVVGILDRTAGTLFEAGRWDTLAGWIDALPEAEREAHPQLLAHRGRIHAERGQHNRALALLERAEQAFATAEDWPRAAHLLAAKGSLLRFQGRYAEALDHCCRALSLARGQTAQEKVARALAHKNTGLCHIRQGELAAGRQALRQALRLYEELDALHDTASVYHDLGMSHELAGDLAGAAEHYRAALGYWEQAGNLSAWANTLNGLGVVYTLQGDYDRARTTLNEALTRAQQAQDLRIQAFALASLGDLYRDLADHERARGAFAQALEIARQAHSGFIVTYALDGLGNLARLAGDLPRARRRLLQALEHAQEHASPYETGMCQSSLGILANEEGDLAAARRHLDQAVDILRAAGFQQPLGRAYLNRAQAAFLAGERQDAVDDLERALAVASALGFDQFLVVDGLRLGPLLRFGETRRTGGEALPRLLQRIEEHRLRVAQQPQLVVQAEPEPDLKIQALGQPEVAVDGLPVQWVVAKSRDLFFFLLQHPQGLNKEQIGATFWPDHPPDRLDSAFRSTLYRLRRAVFRDSVLFEDGLYRFNWVSDYWFDVEIFEELLHQAGQVTVPEEAVALFVEALSLYRGDYLQGIYDDWPVVERERLRARFVASLETLARLYADQRKLQRAVQTYQRLLTEDPYQEVAHRELMRCHYRLGDRAAAIRQYQACVEILREELGLSPALETEDLYRQIIG